MRKVLLLATTAILVTAPAHATLQVALTIGPDNFFCADNTACDTNPAVGVLQVADAVVDGIDVNGSIQAAVTGAPFLSLNTSSLSLINTTSSTAIATVAVGATDFTGPADTFHSAGSGVWQGPGNSTITMGWFVDPLNRQGADNAFDVPGTQVDTFSNVAGAPTSSFHHDGLSTLFNPDLFSMTEQATVTLAPGEALVNRGQTIVSTTIPESPTWAMLLVGFAGLMFGASMRKRLREFY